MKRYTHIQFMHKLHSQLTHCSSVTNLTSFYIQGECLMCRVGFTGLNLLFIKPFLHLDKTRMKVGVSIGCQHVCNVHKRCLYDLLLATPQCKEDAGQGQDQILVNCKMKGM